MDADDHIKLQLVLREARPSEIARADLEGRLGELGMSLTAMGLATASAVIAEDAYRRLWGEPPPLESGFLTQAEGPDLAVPPALAPIVQSIALVPRHLNFKLRSLP
jgi:hypothetical protein